jgi:ABC-type transport system substrate-binding protein
MPRNGASNGRTGREDVVKRYIRGVSRALTMACVATITLAATTAEAQQKVIRIPMTTSGPGTLDPVRGSTTYENRAASCVYETLLQYKYLARPLELTPLLLSEMPEVTEEGKVWRFRLRDDVYFHDDPCFPGGEGRKLVSKDVFYSWKRLADPRYQYKSWWLVEGIIKGFDEYKAHQAWRLRVSKNAGALAGLEADDFMSRLVEIGLQNSDAATVDKELTPELRQALIAEFAGRSAGTLQSVTFDYDAPVAGFNIVNDHEFVVELNKPNQQFIWRLAMFQLSVLPREAVETYNTGGVERFSAHPVGTGPFILKQESDWKRGISVRFERNPEYRDAYYPEEWEQADEAFGLHEAAGQKIPFVDVIEFHFFVESQPMWLQFKDKSMDFTTVPQSAFEEAFSARTKELRRGWVRDGIRAVKVPLLDFIFRAFNMEDPLVGGYTDEKRALRQAFNLAMDWDEMNETFYFGLAIPYDGPIPPGLDGHPNNEDHRAPYSTRGQDLERARQKLREAGYTVGSDGLVKDLPVIELYTSAGAESQRIVELMERNLAEVGIRINPRYQNFSDLMQVVDNRKAPIFSFAWGSDYPDAENNLALFFGPNASPGSNHSNYSNPEYDELYRKIQTMPAGPERTAIYIKMRDMLIKDAPFCGSLARTRVYLIHPWVKNFKPTEDFFTYYKYLDIDTSHPDRAN